MLFKQIHFLWLMLILRIPLIFLRNYWLIFRNFLCWHQTFLFPTGELMQSILHHIFQRLNMSVCKMVFEHFDLMIYPKSCPMAPGFIYPPIWKTLDFELFHLISIFIIQFFYSDNSLISHRIQYFKWFVW